MSLPIVRYGVSVLPAASGGFRFQVSRNKKRELPSQAVPENKMYEKKLLLCFFVVFVFILL